MNKPLERVAAFIVDRRKGFYLIYILLAIFCVFSTSWVKVDNDLTDYLDEASETRRGLTMMDEEFTTYATAEVMVDNITFSDAEELKTELEKIDGVKEIAFDSTGAHYSDAAALFSVTFDGESDDPICETALSEIENRLQNYDLYVSAQLGNTQAETTEKEMAMVMVIACVIILSVLTLTSRTYLEIPVLVITFGMSAMLNKGTNFMFGTISFISNSISVVLQLALAIDYAIILCHRYTEERESLSPRDAVVQALCKAIPEISGSCLTTLSGLGAMSFMHFRLGFDMSMVMIKAIIISIITVFTLMPGLLLSFSPLIDKTHHRSFVPKITAWNNLVVKLRYITPAVFAASVIVCFFLSNNCPYVYSYTSLSTINKNEAQIAQEMIDSTFSSTNVLAVLIPSGDYEKEQALAKELEGFDEVDSVTALAAVEAKDGYSVGDRLSPREFAELTDLDVELVRLVYTAYASKEENYGRIIGGIDDYRIALVDLFDFVYDAEQDGYVNLDRNTADTLSELNEKLSDGKLQLESDAHSRLVLNLNLSEESPETFEFLDTVRSTAEKYYDDVTLAGNSTNDFDLSSTFGHDNTLINILSILFVMLVLFFTFQSAGIPIILILVIQGSIWINFSFPTLMNKPLFFMSYLIVSSIQMGANIDYAIVITNRYTEFRREMSKLEAIKQSLDLAFPTIFTSGSILAAAGAAIGLLSSEPAISSIGVCLSRGTLISIVLVMGILPQLLVLGDFIIDKTSFSIKNIRHASAGAMAVVLAAGLVPTVRAEGNNITISDREELIAFAKNCTLDTWSLGKNVALTADIDMEDVTFSPIPTFGGSFDGGGHKITNLSITKNGSDLGLFRHIQESGSVSNLTVSGKINPGGSMNRIGGIAGDNAGEIQNCAFTGNVEGENRIGGIAGTNSGRIISCRVSGGINGQNSTGGIAGENSGYISGCENRAAVNTSPDEKKRSLTDIDADAGSMVENIITNREENEEESVLGHTDTGGIAGHNTGIIQGCSNTGSVGYQHIGYNVGGIAGRQSGYMLGCKNTGVIRGRKDVGGIVGQAEPYITLTVTETALDQMKRELENLDSMVEDLISDTKDLGGKSGRRLDKIKTYADAARGSAETLANGITEMTEDNAAEINALSASLSNTIGKLADTAGGLTDGFQEAANSANDFSSALETVNLKWPGIAPDIEEISAAVNELRSLGSDRESLAGSIDEIGAALDELRSQNTDTSELDGYLTQTEEAFDRLRSIENGLSDGGLDGINSALDEIAAAEKGLDGARSDLERALNSLEDSVRVKNEAKERRALSDINDSLKNIARNKQEIDAALESIENILRTRPESFREFVGNAEEIADMIRRIRQDLKDNYAALDSVSADLDELILNTTFDAVSLSRAVRKARDAFDGLNESADALTGGLKNLRAAVEDELDAARENGQTLSDAIDSLRAAIEGGRNSLRNIVDAADGSIGSGLDKLDSAIDGGRGNLDSVLTAADKKLSSGFDRLSRAFDSLTAKLDGFASESETQLVSAKELLSSGLRSLSYASEDIGETVSRAADIISDFAAGTDYKFVTPGEDFKAAGEELMDSFGGISEELASLRETFSDSEGLDSLKRISDQLTLIFNLAAGRYESVQSGGNTDHVVDTSDEDIENSRQGKVGDCENYAAVEGDRNVGGIAGALAVEYARDPEDEIEKPDALNFTYNTKAVLAHCVNDGAVTGKKDCVGGVVGLAGIGTVYECESYAPVVSTSGSYVGGVAGRASGSLRCCYSKSGVNGKDYVGGIAGKGESLSGCVSISKIDGDECVGAVLGGCEDRGGVTGNYFIDRGTGGIDGISYSGCAEPAEYGAIAGIPGIPSRLVSFTVTFSAEGETVSVQEIKYGSDTGRIQYPEIPAKEGHFGRWPEIDEGTVSSDIELVCEYTPYITAISSTEKEGGLPIVLAEGSFTDETEIHAVRNGEIYKIELDGDQPEEQGELTLRLLDIPDRKLAVRAIVQIKTGDGWRKVSSKARGRYVVFDTEGPSVTVRLTHERSNIFVPMLVLAALMVMIAAIAVLRKRKKK